MAVLQFVCFIMLVVACISLCSYYNARIEELEEEIESIDEAVMGDREHIARLCRHTYSPKNTYLKILEIEAINSKVDEKDLVVLEQMKKELLEGIE